jgi:hypothetical protein
MSCSAAPNKLDEGDQAGARDGAPGDERRRRAVRNKEAACPSPLLCARA